MRIKSSRDRKRKMGKILHNNMMIEGIRRISGHFNAFEITCGLQMK
jgi:hypothetical protein